MLDDWPFGPAMCSLVPFTQSVSVFVSSYTMTAIAVDRYQACVSRNWLTPHNFRSSRTRCTCGRSSGTATGRWPSSGPSPSSSPSPGPSSTPSDRSVSGWIVGRL